MGFINDITAWREERESQSCDNVCKHLSGLKIYFLFSCRLVTLAAGAAAGKFLKYEENAPTVAAQTAYGIEAVVDGYDERYGGDSMLFMDYRRHHTGLWSGTAPA